MGIKFGEIDSNQILENEYRMGVLEGVVDWILTNNEAFAQQLTPQVMAEIRDGVVTRLRQKYPKSRIGLGRSDEQ